MELDFLVLVAVSRPCIRFSSFRYRFKAVTERSLIFIVLFLFLDQGSDFAH